MTYVEEQDMTADGEAPEWATREVQEVKIGPTP